MKCLASIIVIAFMGMSLFGFLGMLSSDHSPSCITSRAQSALCPEDGDLLSLIAFHANGYKAFSSIPFIALSILGLACLIILGFASSLQNLMRNLNYAISLTVVVAHFLALAGLRRWFARFQLSPSFIRI